MPSDNTSYGCRGGATPPSTDEAGVRPTDSAASSMTTPGGRSAATAQANKLNSAGVPEAGDQASPSHHSLTAYIVSPVEHRYTVRHGHRSMRLFPYARLHMVCVTAYRSAMYTIHLCCQRWPSVRSANGGACRRTVTASLGELFSRLLCTLQKACHGQKDHCGHWLDQTICM